MFQYKGINGKHIGEGVWTFRMNNRQRFCTSLKFCMYMIENKEAYK